MAKNLVGQWMKDGKELDVLAQFKHEAGEYFTTFLAQRDDIEDLEAVADGMYHSMQNRTLLSSEKSKGMNLPTDTRANTGSPTFHRTVNQLASQLSVIMLRENPWRYTTPAVEGVAESQMDGKRRASALNALARYNRKKDNWRKKVPELSLSVYKSSNVFVYGYWKESIDWVTEVVPNDIIEVDQESGQETLVRAGTKKNRKKVRKDGYFSFDILPTESVYLDRYIPNIQSQNCVILTSIKNRKELFDEVRLGRWDEEAVKSITDADMWDGYSGFGDLREDKSDNRNLDLESGSSKMFLVNTVFMYAPIDKDIWDESENVPELYVAWIIGNDVANGKVVGIYKSDEPDGEIPIQDIHVYPDSADTMYHTTIAEVVRSSYSTECTLQNLALDNAGLVNDPPMKVKMGAHRIKDFTYKKGQRWDVREMDAVQEMTPRETSVPTSLLRRQVQEEAMRALGISPADMGQSQGARTSASEYMDIAKQSELPSNVQKEYIVSQFLPWIARKIPRYWEVYGDEQVIQKITNMVPMYNDANPKGIFGEYEIEVNVVEEYTNDMFRANQTATDMQLVASSPQLLRYINLKNLLTQYFESRKYDINGLVNDVSVADAENVATLENIAMVQNGQQLDPQTGEDHETHLRIHEGEALRWRGIESENPYVEILKLHILKTNALRNGEQMAANMIQQMQSVPQGAGSPLEAENTQQQNAMSGAIGPMAAGQV